MLREIESSLPPVPTPPNEQVDTVYLGGGTPSLLGPDELTSLLQAVANRFVVNPTTEITLEANPDDLNSENLQHWQKAGINRLSIGVQSFADADLQWMNRAHTTAQARQGIVLAKQLGFHNLSIDLIYGLPTLSNESWKQHVETAIELGIAHLSCYALTVEEKTALDYFIRKRKVAPPSEQKQEEQFLLLMDWMEQAGFEHYEISNFCRPGHYSRHNSLYWQGVPYYGFGPSAHSFDGRATRWWNVASNSLYIQLMSKDLPTYESELLTPTQILNERIMTTLRLSTGLAFDEASQQIGSMHADAKTLALIVEKTERYVTNGKIIRTGNNYILTRQGKLYADGIAADLFID